MRRLWSVGWAPLAVVALHTALAVAIGHQRAFDPAFHFLGGAAGAYGLLQALKLFRVYLGPISRWHPALVIFLAMVAVTIVWELVEFIGDSVLGTHVQRGTSDTTSDIVLGLLGAVCVLGVAGFASPRESGELRRMVEAFGASLRTSSREELIAVGRQPPETWDVAGRPATVAVIVEPKDDGSLRVVVQGFMPSKWFPAGSSVALDGFYQRPAGAIEQMPDKEFYEFD